MDQARRTYLQRRLKGWEASLSLWLANLLVTVQKVCGAKAEGKLCAGLAAELKRLAHYVMGIVLIHTTLRLTLGAPERRYDPRRAHDMLHLRGVFGADLRRALKGETLAERAAKIRAALDNLEPLIARMVRRLAKGLRHGARIQSRVARAQWLGVAIAAGVRGFAGACADTS